MEKLFAQSDTDGFGKVEVLAYYTNGFNEEMVLIGLLTPDFQGQPIDGFFSDDLLSELEIVSTVERILEYSKEWQLYLVLKEDLTNFHYEVEYNNLKCICCDVEFEKDDTPQNYGTVVGGYGSDYDFIEHEIAICDKCIREKLEKKAINPLRNILTKEKYQRQ